MTAARGQGDGRPVIKEELERIQRLKCEAARMNEAERRRLVALEQKRQEINERLALIVVCLAGYAWRREGSRFGCGRSHVVSFGQLGLSFQGVNELF